MEVVSRTNYTDLHRKFLRTITAKGCVEMETAQKYFSDMKENFPNHSDLQLTTAIQEINNALKVFEQQVSVIKHEQFDKEYLVFSTIARIPDLMTAQQKTMKPNDFKYFEAVLKALLDTENYQLRYKVALTTEVAGTSSSGKRSLAADNEYLLQLWIKLGYFGLQDGVLYLGPKSLVEFKGYIANEYPNIHACDLCLNVTFMNLICKECRKYYHRSCLDKFWQVVPNACPSCRGQWTN